MTVLLFLLALLAASPEAAHAEDMKPLYKLPDINQTSADKQAECSATLGGSDKGLFRITENGSAIPLWTAGAVEQMQRTMIAGDDGVLREAWYFRTAKGILFSSDLIHFELRNNGLPFLTIKKYDGKETKFEQQVQELKDICINPMEPRDIVTATKDAVYLSRDGGVSWESIGSMSGATPGIKAVAIATMNDGTLVVFMSHPIFGLSYILPDRRGSQWCDVSGGFAMMPSMTSPDEMSDILPLVRTDAEGKRYVEIYISQMYLPTIYRFNWETKRGELIYRGTEPCDSIDGLTSIDTVLLYTKMESLGSFDVQTQLSPGVPAQFDLWKKTLSGVPGAIEAAWIPQNKSGFSQGILLNELWMLYPGTINTRYASVADGKKCVYVSAYQCREQAGIDKFKKIIKDNKLNGLVIDMKDDYGFLRYDSKDPLVMKKGRVTQYAIDLDHFVSEFKKDNVYLIARIVVFKDKNLTKYDGGKYAVWDNKLNAPWVGIKEYEDVKDASGKITGHGIKYYDENWVDPYSPEVWEYNIQIAKELVTRGFDEIQFDYIRFPTDGYNLHNAQFRWQSKGMDKESALISFLSYARENLNVPIGIDIYGANGWYRSGTRTGQDAELLSEYVDVIGPMFYPSHFEADFMNCAPYPDRAYRIYFYGTYRATVLTRNRAIIRPWVQAFKLNVAYDRQYYGPEYIRKEIFGVRDSVNRGYMYWNNGGDYSNLRPDISDEDKYSGTAPEAVGDFRRPEIGSEKAPAFVDEGISIIDSVYNQEKHGIESPFVPLLRLPPFPTMHK